MTDTPETFDLDAWLSGASRPQRSVRIFQRGDMLAELDELGREIELAEAVGDAERSLTDASPTTLRQKYAELSEEFAASCLDVRVQGHDQDETKEIMGERFAQSDIPAVERDLIFDALVYPKMTREQYDRFVGAIGPAQFEAIKSAYTSACRALPKPSADFLPQSSTADDTE